MYLRIILYIVFAQYHLLHRPIGHKSFHKYKNIFIYIWGNIQTYEVNVRLHCVYIDLYVHWVEKDIKTLYICVYIYHWILLIHYDVICNKFKRCWKQCMYDVLCSGNVKVICFVWLNRVLLALFMHDVEYDCYTL